MRLLMVIFIMAVIGLTCGPKVTETAGTVDNSLSLSGRVVYADTINKGAPEVWVICGTVKTDSTAEARIDSALTDLNGKFILRQMPTGNLFYELYREPRSSCLGKKGEFSFYSDEINRTWVYSQRPDCPNAWGDTTTDSTYK